MSVKEGDGEREEWRGNDEDMPTATGNFLIFLSCLLKNPTLKFISKANTEMI